MTATTDRQVDFLLDDFLLDGFPADDLYFFRPRWYVDDLDVSAPVKSAIAAYHELSESERSAYDPLDDREIFNLGMIEDVASGRADYESVLDAEEGVSDRAIVLSWLLDPQMSPTDRRDFVDYVVDYTHMERFTEEDIRSRIAAKLSQAGPVLQSAGVRLSTKDLGSVRRSLTQAGLQADAFDCPRLRWLDVVRPADEPLGEGMGRIKIADAQVIYDVGGREVVVDLPGTRAYRLDSDICVDSVILERL